MGKTVPSFRMALESEIGSWRSYRRALKIGDRRIFDELMSHTRSHASASGNAVLKRELDGLMTELEGP
jgi:hypothetical protein